MLGSTIRATGIVGFENVKKAIKDWFPAKLADINVNVISKAYEEAKTE